MKNQLRKLWNDYFAEECATIDTDEERELIRKTAEMNKRINELLPKEQNDAMQKYIEAIYEMQSIYAEKAFLKGCKLAVSFILEAENF